ncbi:MAG: N-acetylmuramoyl-L-alanine amidase, partial [Patescibacteria group bacterium]
MSKNFLKSVFLSSALIGLFFMLPPKVLAIDYAEHDIKLERQGDVLISEVIPERAAFNTVVVRPEKNIDGLMVNFGAGWEPVEIHDDGFGHDRLVVTAPTHTMRFRWDQPGADKILNLKVTLFFYEEGNFPKPTAQLQASSALTAKAYSIISRSEWGADEELRVWNPDNLPASDTKNDNGTTYIDPCSDIEKNYANEFRLTMVREYNSDGQPLTWPLQYASKIEKFIIHHTDSEIRDLNGDSLTDTRDFSAIMRAIYYYHTISRGWGDIGYNYVIDPLGNIYEGRYGGDKVIGAHALCYNHGTLGIAVIGDYQNNEVPEPAMQALIWLIGKKYSTCRQEFEYIFQDLLKLSLVATKDIS